MPDFITISEKNTSIQHLRQIDRRFDKVFQLIGPITYKPHGVENAYPHLVNSILEQMLSNKAAAVIQDRMLNLCQGSITTDRVSLLSDEEIKSIGTSKSKVSYIRDLTSAVESGRIDFQSMISKTDQQIICELTSIRGIGSWTAKMFLIFVLDRQDILPYEDVAFLQGYRWVYKADDISPESVQKKCKKWRPYSSIAARYMYKVLDLGFTKGEFHLYK